MGSMCWEINPGCFVKGQKQGESPCPAYNENKGCWQIDWSFVIASLTDSEKERWKSIMKDKCPSCPVFAAHRDELAMIIRMVSVM